MIPRYDQGMTTHPEPIDHSHPAVESLAREVLEREERLSAYTYSIPLAAQASWDATRSEQVKAAPDLARAVIELTAKVERVEALAETWEEAARLVEARGGDAETVRDLLQDIRDALNGENA